MCGRLNCCRPASESTHLSIQLAHASGIPFFSFSVPLITRENSSYNLPNVHSHHER